MTSNIALIAAGTSTVGDPASGVSGNARPQMAKASLELYDPAPASGGSALGAQRGSISFQFNPKEVTIAKSAKWERKTAKGSKTAGPPEFTGPEPCKLTLEMFFDASAKHDSSVVDAVESLFACCVPTAQTSGQAKPSPPLVVLHWGAVRSFGAFVTSVSAKYTLFDTSGVPIRAVCSVALEEMPGAPPSQNPTSGALSARAVHTVIAGETLATLAFAEYGDAALWRAVAAYNGIDDPLRVRVGSTVVLPAVEELG